MSMTVLPTADGLRGPMKAAIVMLTLGEERCATLFRSMQEEEIRQLSSAMMQLGTVAPEIVERVCGEFIDQLGSSGSVRGNYESTEKLLLGMMPRERVQSIMQEVRGPVGRTMWDKLGNVSETQLTSYLRNEHPQTVAVILSKIKPEQSARVLALLPESAAIDVVSRMLRMDSVQQDVLDGVESTLRTDFMTNLSRSSSRDTHELMAEIFNNLDRPVEQRLIDALDQSEPDAAEKIKSLMFTFQDLSRLPPAAIQTILRAADREKLPVALKGAPPAILKTFTGAMSERAAKMLREDIASLGPMRLRDVDEAQAAIVLVAKELAAAGEIDIAPPGASEQMVM